MNYSNVKIYNLFILNWQMKKEGIWGILAVIIGIFFFLIYFNILPTLETSFKYGRIAALSLALLFSLYGITITFSSGLGIKIPKIVSKVLLIVILALMLVLFHKVYSKEKVLLLLLFIIIWYALIVLIIVSGIRDIFSRFRNSKV